MKLVSFDYTRQTVTITKQIGNIIYLEIISWDEMLLRNDEEIEVTCEVKI